MLNYDIRTGKKKRGKQVYDEENAVALDFPVKIKVKSKLPKYLLPQGDPGLDEIEVGSDDTTRADEDRRRKDIKASKGADKKAKSEPGLIETLLGKSAKAKSSQPAGKLNTGTSLVDYLKSIGEDSSFGVRKEFASDILDDIGDQSGEYKGTAEQNTKVLAHLKKNKDYFKGFKGRSDSKPEDDGLDEKHIFRQNEQEMKHEDMQDGTWEEYLDYVKNSEESPVGFAVFKRKRSLGLV